VITSVGRPLDGVKHRSVPTSIGSFGGGLDFFVASQAIRLHVDGAVQAIVVEWA
jgi:hypothetical protein